MSYPTLQKNFIKTLEAIQQPATKNTLLKSSNIACKFPGVGFSARKNALASVVGKMPRGQFQWLERMSLVLVGRYALALLSVLEMSVVKKICSGVSDSG